MSANQPEMTIDDEVRNHGGRSITYFELYKKRHHTYEQYLIDRDYADQQLIAALSAMFDYAIGEDEPVYEKDSKTLKQIKTLVNNRKQGARQRAAKMGFNLNKELKK
jgi:hypothetical protein